MTRKVAHVPGVAVVMAALVASLATLALPYPSEAQQREPVRFPPAPAKVPDCSMAPGQGCVLDAWTGETTVSPKLIREGETLNVSVAIFAGAISYDLPELGECSHVTETRDMEVNVDGRYQVQPTELQVGSTCAFAPGPTNGTWSQIAASITGPCGSMAAVEEGRAEFADCGHGTDSDYYGVIGKDEELWGISGTFKDKEGRGLGGVLVELSGEERQVDVSRPTTGDYAFLVPEGGYTVTTEPGFCAVVDGAQGSGCSSSASVSVPGSHAVDFRPEKEGTISGTVYDADGKGLGGVTVSAVGRMGSSKITDNDGAYKLNLATGPYTVSAAGAWQAGVDEAGQPTRVRTDYCSESGAACDRSVRVEVDGDETLDWHDRGLVGAKDDDLVPVDVAEPEPEAPGPEDLDWLFIASVIAAGGAGAGVIAAGSGGSEGGGAGGGSGPPRKPWDEMTEEEKAPYRSALIRQWMDDHPGFTAEQFDGMMDALYQQPAGFWDKSIQGLIDTGRNYWDELSSGEQSDGLLITLEGMGSGFSKAGWAAWDEIKQTPGTLAELPGVYWDEVASGEQNERLWGYVTGMVDYGDEVMSTASDFYSDPNALQEAIDKHGPQVVEEFMAKAHELDAALMSKDKDEIRRLIGEIAGRAEFEVLVGGLTDKGMDKALLFVKEVRLVKETEAAVDAMRGTGKGIDIPKVTPEMVARRDYLKGELDAGRPVRLEAGDIELFVDPKIVKERYQTILEHSTGDASEGAFTIYKTSDDLEGSLTARWLQEQDSGRYVSKLNATSDKAFLAGEEQFMSANDLARLDRAKLDGNPLNPGEAINYKPKTLVKEEYDALSPDMKEIYDARVKDAASWDKYIGPENAKSIDMTDPGNIKKYGPYYSGDATDPVAELRLWKDPKDNRILVQYKEAGSSDWSAPKYQVKDVDTITHGGGQGLADDVSETLQYLQSKGQLGEGDTPAWAREVFEAQPGTGELQLRADASGDSLVKALDQLRKAEANPVVVQNADGVFLQNMTFPERQMLEEASRNAALQGRLTTEQMDRLSGWGVLPPAPPPKP